MDINRFRLPGFERKFSREPRNRALLAIIQRLKKPKIQREDEILEMKELSRSASVRIMEEIEAYVPQPSPSHFLRKGKLAELKLALEKSNANILICNVDLTPSQAGNIEKFLNIPVIDRTGLILEIFGKRAQSKEGKLQVELAQLNYVLPRIGGLGTVMSRLGGGVGTRGPGEQELERDRRKVRKRIQKVKDDLKKVRKHRNLIRSGRKRKNLISIALVGYTNAGKSTLLNTLTGAKAVAEDKLFATLDPKARAISNNGHRKFLFVDTVGFINHLPHTLIESFHATLEEASQSDVLVHVLDVSHPNFHHYKESVEEVLAEIKASDKPCILALNKADLLEDNEKQHVQNLCPEGVMISAAKGWGLNHLLLKLDDLVKALSLESKHLGSSD